MAFLHVHCLVRLMSFCSILSTRADINALPAFFMLSNIASKLKLDPEAYHRMILQRDIEFIRTLWQTRDESKSGSLNKDAAMEVLRLAAEVHWKDELSGLDTEQKDDLIRSFCNMDDGNEFVSFQHVQSAFEINSRRCIFSGANEIVLRNLIGTEIGVGSAASLTSGQIIEAGSVAAININDTFQFQLSFSIERYKQIRGVSLSPYQSVMLPLHRKRSKGSKREKSRHSNASGFR